MPPAKAFKDWAETSLVSPTPEVGWKSKQWLTMKTVIEEHSYREEVAQFIPDERQADELLGDLHSFLAMKPEDGRPVDGTDFRVKTYWDIPNGRYLEFYYRVTDTNIILRSLREHQMM